MHSKCNTMHSGTCLARFFVAHAKTNHFTFALIEAVTFALAVHYSFAVVFCFHFFFQDVYAVIFTHAMPTAFVKCHKKQIISMLDRILWMCACCAMLTDSFLIFQWALSLFSVQHFVLFRWWWSVFRTVDADAHSLDDCNKIIYVFTLGF